ncbi:MAG: RagB/SusD family nutrient uptake outer membrane protein [Tenacibaculum sp.]
MKKLKITITTMGLLLVSSCSSNLDINPQGRLIEENIVRDEVWVNQQLISAYAVLDGHPSLFFAPASNWTLGDVASDDFYKGSSIGDQPPLNDIERYSPSTTNIYLSSKWNSIYDGISKCNQTLLSAEAAINLGASSDNIKILTAEARFLRAHYHMEAKKIWNNIPFVSETTTEVPSNTVNAWPLIQEDLNYAILNLPNSQNDKGRASLWTAKAYLAKAFMFQNNLEAAKPVLDDIINNGPYDLVLNYHDNFNAEKENNVESVFAVQNSVNDGGQGLSNGNPGGRLNHPYTPLGDAPGDGCCGFFQPSQNLVNAFKTDAKGLPLLDTFNDEDVKSDQGISSDTPFSPYTGTLDPRLDWAVGRRDIEYLGWGPMPGKRWIRDQENGGPYVGKKHEYLKSQAGTLSASTNGAYSAVNTPLVRYSDILLWRAEIHAENNELNKAMLLVNRVRNRAANPDGFVKNEDGSPAANYLIKPYESFPDKEYAVKAVRFERRLELASEGHRFFDLVRWGIAEQTLNNYISIEATKRSYLAKAVFREINNYYPIPLEAINSSGNVLEQNSGY